MNTEADIMLHLTYTEWLQLLSVLRTEAERRKALTTVSEWHEATYSLLSKVEAESKVWE